jgi:hypothetical protein
VSEHPSNPLPDPAELAANWPAPQPDEPESLRQDILDELNDHLQSAYDHELIKTGDNQTAAARVLDRFGDPSAIARQLWWDAMKGPAMRQMLLVVVSAVSTTLSVAALGGLVWFASAWQSANTRLGELQRELAQNAMQQQADRESLRKELSAQFASQLAARGEANATFLPLKLRVIGETSRRPITQTLSFALKPPLPAPIPKPSEDKGDLIYDFGLVPPGNYSLSYIATEDAPWMGTQSFWVRPGNPEIIETTYPDPDVLKPGRLRIDLGVPDDLRTADLEKLRFGIELRGIYYQGANASWQHPLQLPGKALFVKSGRANTLQHLVVIVDGMGRVVETIGCHKAAREDGQILQDFLDDLCFERQDHNPSEADAALLIGGVYTATNNLWMLSSDMTGQSRIPAQWLSLRSPALETISVEISSTTDAHGSLTNETRVRLWNWVRWSGILPATETVALPVHPMELLIDHPTDPNLKLDGLGFRSVGDSIEAGSRPFDHLESYLKHAHRVFGTQSLTESEPLSEHAVWLTLKLSEDVLRESDLEGQTRDLQIGRVAVASTDRAADTISVRVNSFQKQLLERLLSIGGNKLSLRIAAHVSRFPDDLLREPFHHVAVLKAVMPTEPTSHP